MSKVTVIGLGIIGGTWARHYALDGHTSCGWNRTPKPEHPQYAANLEQALAGSDVVHICLAGPPSIESVFKILLPQLKAGMLVIQSSTISPAAAARFAEQVEATGAAYLEAPFTGSKPAAEARQLVFFLGGTVEAIDAGLNYLQPLSRMQFRFTSPAQAAAIKLSMNLQIAAVGKAMTEGLALAGAYGIDKQSFFAVLDQNVARSGLVDLKRPKLLAGDFSPQFSVKHMGKDLLLALESGGSDELPLTARCSEIYQQHLADKDGDLDFIAVGN